MIRLLFFVGLWAIGLVGAYPTNNVFSYSPSVGSGSGVSYATEGEGRITSVRIWERSNAYITGFQLRYGFIWSHMVGVGTSNPPPQEIELFEGERIVEVSGKYSSSNYIYQLIFTTSRGRTLRAGQPTGNSFNFYATHKDAELRQLSGRHDGSGIRSLGAHWGVPETDKGNDGTAL